MMSSGVCKRLGLVALLAVIGAIIYVGVTAAGQGTRDDPSRYVSLYNHAVANTTDRELRCIQTVTVPRVDVCVYSASEDRYVSAQLLKDGVWEPNFLKIYEKALRNYPDSDVIDLGAHIGFHTLLAAKLGHRVLAVEPVSSSLRRIHHAALLSGVRNNITLFHNAIYNSRTYAWLRQPHGNIGGTSIVIADPAYDTNEKEAVQTILTDDLFPFIHRRIALIKMDIEGCECRAISSATQLFSGVHIPYIFMDWSLMFLHQRRPNTACTPESIERMTIFLAHRGYVPYEARTSQQLDWRQSTLWRIGYVYWRHVSAEDLREPPSTTPPPPREVDDEDYSYNPW